MLTKRKLLKISSEDRDFPTDTTTQFRITIRNFTLQNIKAVSLKHLTFKHLHENIQSWNNTLVIYTGLTLNEDIADGTGYEANRNEIVIPTGQISAVEAAPIIETQLNTILAPQTFTVTLNSDDKFEITSTSGEYFAILGDDYGSNPLGKLLGFYDNTNKTGQLTHTASGTPQFGGIESAYLHGLIGQTHTIDIDGKNSDIMAVIPVNESYGETVIYQSDHISENLIVYPNLLEMNELYFRLSDSRGNTLNLQGNQLEMVFELLF